LQMLTRGMNARAEGFHGHRGPRGPRGQDPISNLQVAAADCSPPPYLRRQKGSRRSWAGGFSFIFKPRPR
jgi:hypothetical protein